MSILATQLLLLLAVSLAVAGLVYALHKSINPDHGLFRGYLPWLAAMLLPSREDLQNQLDSFTNEAIRNQWLIETAMELKPIIQPLGACGFCFNFWISFLIGIPIVIAIAGVSWTTIFLHFFYVGAQNWFFNFIKD